MKRIFILKYLLTEILWYLNIRLKTQLLKTFTDFAFIYKYRTIKDLIGMGNDEKINLCTNVLIGGLQLENDIPFVYLI